MTKLFVDSTKSIKKAIAKELEGESAKQKQVSEINIRKQKISLKFQRFVVVANMLKEGKTRLEILDRLMKESGNYAGTNKALSEKSTKNFIGKVTACYNGLIGGGGGKVADEMYRLSKGLDVTKECTFKSYARLTYNALQ